MYSKLYFKQQEITIFLEIVFWGSSQKSFSLLDRLHQIKSFSPLDRVPN